MAQGKMKKLGRTSDKTAATLSRSRRLSQTVPCNNVPIHDLRLDTKKI